MNALVLKQNGLVALETVPDPIGPENWPLVRVDSVGVCGSDIPRAFGGGAYHYPLVMGHEFSGTVVSDGRKVTVIPLLPCKSCEACRSLSFAQCENYDYFGSRRDGGFAEFVTVPEENLIPVPEGVSQDHAAMTEPSAVALHGVRKLPVRGGDSAVVYGAGPIGNLAAQWLRVRGCEEVTLVDIDAQKLAKGEKMGFSVWNPADGDPVARCIDVTEGRGMDLAVEACGLPLTFTQALASVGRSASVLFLGNIHGTFSLEEGQFSSILRNELKIFGTWNSSFAPRGRDDWSTSLRYMQNVLDLESLISHRLPLSDGPRMLTAMHEKLESYSKVILHPGKIQ